MNHDSYLFQVYHTKKYQRDYMKKKGKFQKCQEEECQEFYETSFHLLYMTLFQMIMLFIINSNAYGFVEYVECVEYGMQYNRMQNTGFPFHAEIKIFIH